MIKRINWLDGLDALFLEKITPCNRAQLISPPSRKTRPNPLSELIFNTVRRVLWWWILKHACVNKMQGCEKITCARIARAVWWFSSKKTITCQKRFFKFVRNSLYSTTTYYTRTLYTIFKFSSSNSTRRTSQLSQVITRRTMNGSV